MSSFAIGGSGFDAVLGKFPVVCWSSKKLKTTAAKITNSKRKKEGRPPAKFHRG